MDILDGASARVEALEQRRRFEFRLVVGEFLEEIAAFVLLVDHESRQLQSFYARFDGIPYLVVHHGVLSQSRAFRFERIVPGLVDPLLEVLLGRGRLLDDPVDAAGRFAGRFLGRG